MSLYSFSKDERLHFRKDFEYVFRFGKRYANKYLLMYVLHRKDSSDIRRLGLVVGKKLCNAVRRNKLKRRLREIFRLNKYSIVSGIDMVIIPFVSAVDIDYHELEKAVKEVWKNAHILLNR